MLKLWFPRYLILCLATIAWSYAIGSEIDTPSQPTTDLDAGLSRFSRTVLYLQSADPELQAEFVRIALTQLSRAYELEVDLALNEAKKEETSPGLWAWASSVELYSRQLSLVLEDVELGFPVLLSFSDHQPVSLSVADRTFILTHPRVTGQSLFEQSILAEFCTRHPCDKYTPAANFEKAIPMLPGNLRPDWAFTEDGPVCSSAGLNLHFSEGVKLSLARDYCKAVISEAVELANGIAWQQRHAVSVNWASLQIARLPGKAQHEVALNVTGDSVIVVLPFLYASPSLFQAVLPWVRGKTEGVRELQLHISVASLEGT
jgi:hypothetical protein